MNMFIKSIIAAAIATVTLAAQAEIVVKDAWVRATVPQQKATGAFMQIQSTKNVRLIEVQSAAAGLAEVHEMKMDNNVMKMRAIPQLDVPAGKNVELKPGGYHVMLMDLKAQAKAGDAVTLKLIFEDENKKQETVDVKATVKSLTTMEHKM
ncbi:copper chaperone PCu(A)C [Undibacterium aquatile]|uniref:Copper chaperone PCu(A)C n=1 Tax=Undibacterium aquatile TaxID=1537398 RepID=A0ABR6XJ46_9BURK|nr:copper chaperone PCu(A)C [Undibacterium aquatile]MBC3812930.1 copper chaperone PCu(A)C [Undibacterium aquatile]